MSAAWVDRLGTVAASACAVHCLVMSLAPALFSMVGLASMHDEAFEWAFVGCAILFASVGAALGHRTHGAWSVSGAFALGAGALLAARLMEVGGLEGGVWVAVAGGVALVGAHLSNRVRCRACAAGTCR